jgi:HAD superfamily hydrolase (TIGR01509 family)
MTMPPYDGILFDFDGVLADSEPVHFACWRDVLAPLGIRVEWDDYAARFVGLPDRTAVEMICRDHPTVSFEDAWNTYGRKSELFREKMLAAPPIHPETGQLLRSLGGYPMAVVTASTRREIEPVLERAGIRPLFGAVVCREDVAANKPAPDAYLLAARLLGLRRPLVVEDSDTGEAAGRAAGFDVLRVAGPLEVVARLPERLKRL